jgi:hypothetical protein
VRSSTISVRTTRRDWDRLREHLFTDDGNENAAVLFCGRATRLTNERLLVQDVLPVPEDAYAARLPYHLEVAPRFFNTIVDHCLDRQAVPLIVHSHRQGYQPRYSVSDDAGERRLIPVLNDLLPGADASTLLLNEQGVAGRRLVGDRFVPMRELTVIGRHITAYRLDGNDPPIPLTEFVWDRQVRIFGTAGQQRIAALRISIVGVGGIGSTVAEQAVRAGIRRVTLIDPESLEATNIPRVFGATHRDIGKPKTAIIARHLKRLGAEVQVIKDTAIRQPVLEKLRHEDLVFSCVDNDRTRAILNRFAHQYLVPVVDVGIRLDARGERMQAAAGRVSILGSGLACLRCSHHISAERIRAESLPPEERRQLEREGYILGVDEPAPAIVSLNTVVAGLGVTAGLNLFVELTGGEQPLDQLYDATRGTVFVVQDIHESGCDVCGTRAGIKAKGDAQIISAYE